MEVRLDTWVIFALVAQLAWATGIYIDKFLLSPDKGGTESHNAGRLVLVSASFGLVTAGLAAIVSYSLYGWAATDVLFHIGSSTIATGLLVGALEVVWLWPYFLALHYADETTAPPVFQTIPIFGVVLGYVWFGEEVSIQQLLAMLLVVGGAFWLNLQFVREEKGRIRTAFNFRSVLLMLFSSLIIALVSFLFKDVALEENFWVATFWMGLGIAASGIAVAIGVPGYRYDFISFIRNGSRELQILNLVNESVDATAIVLFSYAVVLAPSTAIVQATQTIQPVLLLLFGWVLARLGSTRHAVQLGTGELVRRAIGVLTILVGSLLLFT